MSTQLRVLCMHGVGDHHSDLSWQAAWRDAITAGLPNGVDVDLDFEFAQYDDLFETHDVTFAGTLEAVAKMAGNAASDLFRRRRGLFGGMHHTIRWTAGMVVQWVENDELREQSRQRIAKAIADYKPNIVFAHSLGSLVAYDTLTDPSMSRKAAKDITFVSLGSQIGNPFVIGSFRAGRLSVPGVKRWFHLYNAEDAVFTSPIRLNEPAFEQINTDFDIDGVLDHDACEYLSNGAVTELFWPDVLAATSVDRKRALRATTGRPRHRPKRRALLVGINEYPNPGDRLSGCVNDAFLVSSVLQECGFDAEDIRVVLDNRATADGIRSRLQWLLDGAGPGDELVFFYSGHGAQLPTYGIGDVVDHKDESLVPYDFDWSDERAITDDHIYDLYSQLDYETNFMMMLDCCHSGGMARGAGPVIRGLDPPDDIRHRLLRWDLKHAMWVEREMRDLNRALTDDSEKMAQFAGSKGSTRRFGRAMCLRTLPESDYGEIRADQGHHGPYMPVILQACRENEYSYEYRHGVTSYGAFTYCLAKILRSQDRITFSDLVAKTRQELAELGYDQKPSLAAPTALKSSLVPFRTGGRKRKKGSRKKSR